jgi:hypothetical protein
VPRGRMDRLPAHGTCGCSSWLWSWAACACIARHGSDLPMPSDEHSSWMDACTVRLPLAKWPCSEWDGIMMLLGGHARSGVSLPLCIAHLPTEETARVFRQKRVEPMTSRVRSVASRSPNVSDTRTQVFPPCNSPFQMYIPQSV